MARTGPWTDADRDDFVRAMGSLGHGQTDCARRLQELGLKADQSSVSAWASGRVSRPQARTVAILRRYIEEAVASPGSDGASEAYATVERDAFDDAVSSLTREPLLGPRQAALVDALTERLRNGHDMNEHAVEVSRDLFQLLNLRGDGR